MYWFSKLFGRWLCVVRSQSCCAALLRVCHTESQKRTAKNRDNLVEFVRRKQQSAYFARQNHWRSCRREKEWPLLRETIPPWPLLQTLITPNGVGYSSIKHFCELLEVAWPVGLLCYKIIDWSPRRICTTSFCNFRLDLGSRDYKLDHLTKSKMTKYNWDA